jgi:hypothetical protein
MGVQSDSGWVLNDDRRAKWQQEVYNDDWGGKTKDGGV